MKASIRTPKSSSFGTRSETYEGKFGREVTSAEHRAGWDATFSAPKSVSLTALVGGDDRVREAHRESVRAALQELERYTQARIGNVHAPETTGKFIAATFEHDTARPVDGYAAPQLHTHAVIFNLTERENGLANVKQMRALQPHEMFLSQRYVTAVYRSELALHLEKLGYELERGKYGQPEVKGYSKEYLEASSPRREQIKDHLREQGIDGAAAAQIAAHHTRDRKELLFAWRSLTAAPGVGCTVRASGGPRRRPGAPTWSIPDAGARGSGEAGRDLGARSCLREIGCAGPPRDP